MLYRDIIELQLEDWRSCGGSEDVETVFVANELYVNPEGNVDRTLDGVDIQKPDDLEPFFCDEETVLGI